ncbi:hypothetical protein [Jatrophihabitans lederbergiae]|uniref:hypothetical protein n=1 Tax=Jatrophihabitans lederbergiae TaxID=3075547 RepID=UPI00288A6D3F|nr:hypothetical protein [Jatrophihabitans sp. DSM 44399]
MQPTRPVQKALPTAVQPVPRACTTVARMVARPVEPTAVPTAEPMVARTAEPMVARTAALTGELMVAWPAARDR